MDVFIGVKCKPGKIIAFLDQRGKRIEVPAGVSDQAAKHVLPCLAVKQYMIACHDASETAYERDKFARLKT